MIELKNIYDVLEEMDFENKCEKYALGFQRDTDTPIMTKFRQGSAKEFAFSLIQEFYERALGELERTKKKLDICVGAMKKADHHICVCHYLQARTDLREALKQINKKE